MKLGTKARYAVMALVDLAKEGADAPVSLSDISERQDISVAYLEQIFVRLRRAELVLSVRGPGGGYALTRSPEEIRISDIVAATNEEIRATRCHVGGAGGCMASGARCLTHDLWDELGRQIQLFLSAITLQDVVARRVLGAAALFDASAEDPRNHVEGAPS